MLPIHRQKLEECNLCSIGKLLLYCAMPIAVGTCSMSQDQISIGVHIAEVGKISHKWKIQLKSIIFFRIHSYFKVGPQFQHKIKFCWSVSPFAFIIFSLTSLKPQCLQSRKVTTAAPMLNPVQCCCSLVFIYVHFRVYLYLPQKSIVTNSKFLPAPFSFEWKTCASTNLFVLHT